MIVTLKSDNGRFIFECVGVLDVQGMYVFHFADGGYLEFCAATSSSTTLKDSGKKKFRESIKKLCANSKSVTVEY